MSYLKGWLLTIQLSIKCLLLHPMRSFLTVLGIQIGVAAVICLLALGEGISQEAQKQIAELGARNIIVRSIKPQKIDGILAEYGLTHTEFELIKETIPQIDSAVPIREIAFGFSYDAVDVDGRIVGSTPTYYETTNLEIDRGRFISGSDVAKHRDYCVVSHDVAKKLFPYQDPLGKSIRLKDRPDLFEVIGVLKQRGTSAGIGGSLAAEDFTKDVYIPFTTFNTRMGKEIFRSVGGSFGGEKVELHQATFKVSHIDDVMPAFELIKDSLRHHDEEQDISIVVPLELLEQAKNMRIMLMVVMAMIAGVSLFVGGIGIMNIMLATVTERTREIGVRRALGARQSAIIRQFLVETITLSVVGGLLGIVIGFITPNLILGIMQVCSNLFPEQMAALPPHIMNAKPQIVEASVPISFGVAVFVGTIFGVYPALRAAKMDPIEALRHE
ncbi:MAG: ABC transporter permease [Pirellulales bacterium]|mgnify:FL=1|jgi:putative ABC transport system permease protein|nr:ABC transporter substrate-binding protein [Rhodopirellula sp.]MCH2370185.1 ABC transporter permease [Pirellulales bacterium]|tara:strand:+ start:435 stop:1760 length:1326 start_codon:yes stop_codon:yes gene_type:complete